MESSKHERLELARHLGGLREFILTAWRAAVRGDQKLVTGGALPRAQLDDHIPALLEAFEDRLIRSGAASAPRAVAADQAAAHGMHRWQQGYDLREVTRELGLLNEVVVEVLDKYWADVPSTAGVAGRVRRIWAELCTTNIEESVARYYDLQRVEARGHVQDLEQAVRDVAELERQRGVLWQQLAHDLRGNVGVVASAASGLGIAGAPDAVRHRLLGLLERNLSSLRNLLDDATDLARLQAGLEGRRLTSFDAAVLLAELCGGLQALAEQRGLYLRSEGPDTMKVEGDPSKLRRIAQNLILNALKFTQVGGVQVRWELGEAMDRRRWSLTVRDTGPGLAAGTAAPLQNALERATDLAQTVEEGDPPSSTVLPPGPASTPVSEPLKPVPAPMARTEGEGIGLSIVKRLSELLDATIEVESHAADEAACGHGTTFRVLFPLAYP